ncbi:MAG: ThiF family adenylyltransferase [Candidatus Paceibacterota bacterium]
MNGHRITLLGSQEQNLKKWLISDSKGYERGAVILFRRFSRFDSTSFVSDRFVAVEVIQMDSDWILDSSKTHLTINMRKFPELYLRCEQENLELGFVHNHPSGYPDFSEKDNENEKNILHGLSGCNGVMSFLVSMVLTNDKWIARIRQGVKIDSAQEVRHVSILSDKLELYEGGGELEENESLKRQAAAFGKPFNDKMQSLRVAIVGLGGTGSATATLLARCGIGELILIDGDVLEGSNMNRVRGYRGTDVSKKKAISLANYIDSLELNVNVVPIDKYIGDSGKAIDAISSADIVFGCTDDIIGRDIMNQAMYYYSLVYIDMGLTGFIDFDSTNQPYLRDHRGRVSCILPESGSCLRCQNVVTDEGLKYEFAIKENPELKKLDSETLKKEHYLVGGEEEAPGVGPFTSATADNAVATLMNLVRGFRDMSSDLRQDNIWIDFIHQCIHSNSPTNDLNCVYCKTGAITLKKEKKYRLDMPLLGEI